MTEKFPEPDLTNTGGAMLAPGQFVEMQGVLWQFVNRSNDGFDQFYNRALNKTESVHFSQSAVAWERREFRILPQTEKPPKQSVLRNVLIPLKCYSEEQQRKMKIRQHYVKRFHQDFLAGKVKTTRGSVENWLKTIDPSPDAKDPEEYLSRYQVPRAYNDWIAGGQRIEALAHGNRFGTHESTLEPVRGIIEDAIEQFHVPFAELEMKDLQTLILKEIEKAQEDGDIPTKDENGEDIDYNPCRQTIYNYIDRLNGHEKRRIREGIDEANREDAPRGRKPRPALAFDEYQLDHALLPVKVKVTIRDKDGTIEDVVMGQVWFTGVMDVATQYLVAMILGTDGPSTARSLEASRFAMCPKGEFFRSIEGLKSHFDVPIIPHLLFVDNGLDLHGFDLDAMMSDMNIENGFAGTYRGDHKESIERFNRRIKDFWRKFPGAVPRPAKRGKRPKKHEVVPLRIEQVRAISWRFVMNYNTTPQKMLGNISPQQAVERDMAKIEAARKMGRPLPLRSTLTMTPEQIDRTFAIRVTATVNYNGARHMYLEWSGSGFAGRNGHQVDIHIPPGDVQEVWIFDRTDKAWFKGYGVWPFYMQGLPYAEHLRIRARVLVHENAGKSDKKKRTLDFKRYMADHGLLLRELFALAGKTFELDRGRKRNEKLWLGSATVGHAVDFAILSTCAAAVDIRENRIPPGWEPILDLKKGSDGVFDLIAIEKPSKKASNSLWEVDEDDDIDMMSDPLRRNDGDEPA
jgi:hypothetical protein